MGKRLLAGIILVSMILHCSCRLGVLDHIYQKRHTLALALGFIDEIPISICGSQYDFDAGLKLEANELDHSIPTIVFHAMEIKLFFGALYNHSKVQHTPLQLQPAIKPADLYGLTLIKPIFHPPSCLR